MSWISEFFLCVGSLSVAGSVTAGIYRLKKDQFTNAKAGVAISLLKLITLLYLIPLPYGIVRIARMGVSAADLYMTGYYGIYTSPVFIKLFFLLGLVWLGGFIVTMIRGLKQLRNINHIMLFRTRVKDPVWLRILQEECGRYHLRRVRLCENELISSPMVVNIVCPTILIPNIRFTELGIHIVLEHEVNHIRSHDLLWKRLALVASWLHWFNPLARGLMRWLYVEQEAECDFYVCSTTKYYTARDYFELMVDLIEKRSNLFFSSGLGDSENSIIRRVELMKARKRRGRASKLTVLGICLIFTMISVLPAYAMTDGVAKAEQKWMADMEMKQYEDDTVANSDVEFAMVENTVENAEVNMSGNVSMYASMVTVDITGRANTRYNFKTQSMQVGDEVTMTIICDDPSVTYWIGIKNMNTNLVRYTQGTGRIYHVFTINEAGRYLTFVENRSNTDADFLGSIIYPN